MLNPVGQGVGALLLAFVFAAACCILAWVIFYSCVIAAHNKHGKPQKFKSVLQDYLIDVALLRLGTTFLQLVVTPIEWAFRTASAILQYALSHWKLIILSSLIVWAGTGVSDHTQEVLEAIDYSYTHYLAGTLNVLKQFINAFRVLLDLATPVWNLFWYVIRRVPIDTLEASVECAAPFLKLTFTELGEFTMDFIRAINVFILRPGVPLNFVHAFYDLQQWAEGSVELVTCYCRDLREPAQVLANVVTTPSTAWALSNLTATPFNLLVTVPANATGPPAQRPSFDVVFDGVIDTILSWSATFDSFLNGIAGLLLIGDANPTCEKVLNTNECTFNASDTKFYGCNGAPNCQNHTDCFFDGRSQCIWYYVPHASGYVVGRTPKIHKSIPLPFTKKGFTVNIPARFYHFVSYGATAWIEAAKVLLRSLINIDKLKISGTAPTEKAALWNADKAFDYWRLSNAFLFDLATYFLDHDTVPSFIRYTPEIVAEIINRWIDLFQFLYNVSVNLVVGVIDKAEGIITWREFFGAFLFDWRTLVVEPALDLCELGGKWGGNSAPIIYPVGCTIESACKTAVQLVNNTFYLIGFAAQGGGSCIKQLENGSFVTSEKCWSPEDGVLMFNPFISAAYEFSDCLPNLMNSWQSMDTSDQGWENANSPENCIWRDSSKPAACKPGMCNNVSEEHIRALTHAALELYPQGRYSDWWSKRCVNSTLCVEMEHNARFARFTRAIHSASVVMGSFNQTCTINQATCDLHNVGQAGFFCTTNTSCCDDCEGVGNGVRCSLEDLEAPCHANCPLFARYPQHSDCQSCGKKFDPLFSPLNGTGWSLVPGTSYTEWSGCICNECIQAAQQNLPFELWDCAWLDPDEVAARYGDNPEKFKLCALAAACNTNEQQQNGLYNAHITLESQCESFVDVALDSCVGCDVSLQFPLCNFGSSLASVWRAAIMAVVGAVNGIVSTIAESVYDQTFYIEWPHRQMNGIVCAAKDIVAALVSILSSLLYDVCLLFIEVTPSSLRDFEHASVPVALITFSKTPDPISPDHFFKNVAQKPSNRSSWNGTYQWATPEDLLDSFPVGIYGSSIRDHNKWARIGGEFCCKDVGGQCIQPDNNYSCPIQFNSATARFLCKNGDQDACFYIDNPTVPICWGVSSSKPYACATHVPPVGGDLQTLQRVQTQQRGQVLLQNSPQVFEQWILPFLANTPYEVQYINTLRSLGPMLPPGTTPCAETSYHEGMGDNDCHGLDYCCVIRGDLEKCWVPDNNAGFRMYFTGYWINPTGFDTNRGCTPSPMQACKFRGAGGDDSLSMRCSKGDYKFNNPGQCGGCLSGVTPCDYSVCNHYIMDNDMISANGITCSVGDSCLNYMGLTCRIDGSNTVDKSAPVLICCLGKWVTQAQYDQNGGCFGGNTAEPAQSWMIEMGEHHMYNTSEDWAVENYDYAYVDSNETNTECTSANTSKCYASGAFCRLTGAKKEMYMSTLWSTAGAVDPDTYLKLSDVLNPDLSTYFRNMLQSHFNELFFVPSEQCKQMKGNDPYPALQRNTSLLFNSSNPCAYPDIVIPCSLCGHPPAFASKCWGNEYGQTGCSQTSFEFYATPPPYQNNLTTSFFDSMYDACKSDCTNVLTTPQQCAAQCRNESDIAKCGICNNVWTSVDECRDLCNNKLPGSNGANWTERIRCGTTEADTKQGRYDTGQFNADDWHDGCTCNFLPDFDKIAEPFKLSQATIQGEENAWIRFDSFETLDDFALRNNRRVKYVSAAGGYHYKSDAASGAPLNTYYETEGNWKKVHALENLRHISDVILNFGLFPVYVIDAAIGIMHTVVETLNGVISPQYDDYVCDIDSIGGGNNALNPQGDKIKNNQPRLPGRIQQIVQCITVNVFKIVKNVVHTIITFIIGMLQSLQVLIEYWVAGQWRLNLAYPLTGENIAPYAWPIESRLAEKDGQGITKEFGYCTENSLFVNANPQKPLCSMGSGVYDVGSEIWSGLYDEVGNKINYNLTGMNGCACDCLKTAACQYDDYLVVSCGHCMIEEMVEELIELQWILDSVLQLLFWTVQVILDALQYVFGAGNLADLEHALEEFVQHLVAFLGVVGKVIYHMLLQIPIFGPILKYIVEDLVCDIVIPIIINQFLAVTYHAVCESIEKICNFPLLTPSLHHNCGWGDNACNFPLAQTCSNFSNVFESEMRPAPLATACMSSFLYNGYDYCKGSDIRPSEATCVSSSGELVFCECNPEIGVDQCCNTTHLYVPGVSEWTGQCDSIAQECVCANAVRNDNKPTRRMFATCGSNNTKGWNVGDSECHDNNGYCRIYNTDSYSNDLEMSPQPCALCDSPEYVRFCEASTGLCACRKLPTDADCLHIGQVCHQSRTESSALYWLGNNASQDLPISFWTPALLSQLRIGPHPPVPATSTCVDFGSAVLNGVDTFCVYTVSEEQLDNFTAAYSYNFAQTLQYVDDVNTNFALQTSSTFIDLNSESIQLRACLAFPCDQAITSCFGGLLYASGWTGSNAQAMIFSCNDTDCVESGAVGESFSEAPIVYANDLNVGLASEWVCGRTSFSPTANQLHAVCIDGCDACYTAQASVASLCSEHNQILNGTLYNGNVDDQYGFVYSFDGVFTTGVKCTTPIAICQECTNASQHVTYLCVDKNYVPPTPSSVPLCVNVDISNITSSELWYDGIEFYTLYRNYSGEPDGTLDTPAIHYLWENTPPGKLLWLYQYEDTTDTQCLNSYDCKLFGFVCSATLNYVTIVSDKRFSNSLDVYTVYGNWDKNSGLEPVLPVLTTPEQNRGKSNAVLKGCSPATYEEPCAEATCLTQCVRPSVANHKPQPYQISYVCDLNATACVQCLNGNYGYLNTTLELCSVINPESQLWDRKVDCTETWQCYPRFLCNDTSGTCDQIVPYYLANEHVVLDFYTNVSLCTEKCGQCSNGVDKPDNSNNWGCYIYDEGQSEINYQDAFPNGTAYCQATFASQACVIYNYGGTGKDVVYDGGDMQFAGPETKMVNTTCSVVPDGGPCATGYVSRCAMDETFEETHPIPTLACYCECPPSGRRRQLLQIEEEKPVEVPQILDVSPCRDESDCWRHAPPSVCSYKKYNRFCDSCPRVLGTIRNRTCTDGYCACKPAEWTETVMRQTAVDLFEDTEIFNSDTLCDAIMHTTPQTESEKMMQVMCQRSVQKAAIFKSKVGLSLPLNIFYDPTSIFTYLTDTLYGLYLLNANSESSVYEQWSVLAQANIDPVRLLNLQSSIQEGRIWFSRDSGGIFLKGVNTLRNAAETATKTIDKKFNLKTAKVLDRSWKMLSRNIANPVRTSAVTATAHMLHNKVTTLKQLHGQVKPQHKHQPQATSTALVTHNSPAPIGTNTPTRQIRWIFPAPRELHVSPNSSCFVVEFMAKDIWVAVESTILYYERVFPAVISRFDAQVQALPSLPPVSPPQQDVVAGCTPTREVDDLWSGFLYAAEFVGQPLCVTSRFFRNIVKQSKAGNITQVEDLLEGAFGCDIYSIQTCQTRRNFVYSIAIWFGLFGAVTVLVSIWAPFLLTPIIGLTLLWLLFFAWWTYSIAPNCLPLVSTCLWDDIFDFFSMLTPYPKIPWGECWKEADGKFINCSKYYASGYDSVGFAVQRWAPEFAERMLNGSQWEKTVNWIVGLDEPLKSFPQNTSLSCQAQTCFWLSSLYLIPFLSGGGLVGLLTSRSVLLIVMLLAALLSFVSSFAISLRLAYLRWPADTFLFRKLYAKQQKTKQA